MPSVMSLFKDLGGDISAAARATHRTPSKAQRENGNYRKGRFTWNGMQIAIENPKGSYREGKGWRQRMASHYGYIVNSEASDADDVDVFIGPDPEGAKNVFVVNQVKPSGAFDEHKCMIGFHSVTEARAGYLACYEKGWKCGGIMGLPVDEFKRRVLAGEFAKGRMRKGLLFFKTYDANEPRDEAGRWIKEPWQATHDEYWDHEYPNAGKRVDGRLVRDSIPNLSSIGSSLDDYDTLKGVRMVRMDQFTLDQAGPLAPDSYGGEKAHRLAEEIRQSGEINPLIVAVDSKGPYIVEGGNRYEALKILGAKSFPAKIAVEYDAEGADRHYHATKQALAEGKPVPAHVLAEYPDLQPGMQKARNVSQEARVPAGKPEGGQWTKVDRSATVPRGIVEVLVSRIKVDPRRFQFKQNLDPTTGAGLELKDVKRFDPELAGVILVWLDPANGRTFVINGHHRVELARRHRVQRLAVRYIDAPNAHKAMVKGALVNMAEGRGTPLDAAKLMRTSHMNQQSLERAGVSLRGQLARQGLGLSKLSDAIFNQVAQEKIPVERGATIGEYFATHHEQDALLAMLKRNEVRGHRLTNAEISELARFVKTAGRRKETITSLFGDEEIERSLAIEKAQLSSWMKLRLLYDKRMFSYVAGKDVAEGLKRSGSHIEVDKARELARSTRIIEDVWDRLVDMKGPINAALNRAAKRLSKGDNMNSIRHDLFGEASAAVAQELHQGHYEEPEASLF